MPHLLSLFFTKKNICKKTTTSKEQKIAPNVYRKITCLDHIIMAILRFDNSPMSEADLFHSHPHEQISFVRKDELYFFIKEACFHHKARNSITVERNKKHSIQTLSPKVELIDCFNPIREDFSE